MYTIKIEENFAAAHLLRDYQGPCASLHGHNYKVFVTIDTEKLDDLGMAIDFYELKTITRKALEYMDHKNLNELDVFSYQNPTAENIARYVFNKVQESLPLFVKMREVSIIESEGCMVTYDERKFSDEDRQNYAKREQTYEQI